MLKSVPIPLALAALLAAMPHTAIAESWRNAPVVRTDSNPDWREIWHDRGVLHDRGQNVSRKRDSTTAPMIAPRVVVDPLFGRGNKRATSRDMPAACLDRVETRYGTQPIYRTGCLQAYPHLAANLPMACRVRLVTWGGTREGYDAACLRGVGYRAAR